MNLYHVDGIHHRTVAFGTTPEEAVAQAVACGEVGCLRDSYRAQQSRSMT